MRMMRRKRIGRALDWLVEGWIETPMIDQEALDAYIDALAQRQGWDDTVGDRARTYAPHPGPQRSEALPRSSAGSSPATIPAAAPRGDTAVAHGDRVEHVEPFDAA
jgi:hypothetical protein